eukprot:CAMPEP_0172499022 /NCGR_PEP_ID=MMETSP1066-20121228/121131_1 /TAXON_ID=671091 /ORGANISM="Coscinodiscus wailesii, Strain CCMP2513" /LENGTH=638 /DNA_ID=CAMNT_0013272555 /DNA_START=56 /DNA_END=1969 /DNA_ORIENTATION=+
MKSILGFIALARTCTGDTIPPPNVDAATYGYNVLLGLPPIEQRTSLIGSKLFSLTANTDISNDGFKSYHQFSDFNAQEKCNNHAVSNTVWWSTSSATLSAQATSSSKGYDFKATIGISVPVKGAELSLETTVRNALVFGNSQSSVQAFSQRNAGKTYSFDAKTHRQLYAVEIDYNSISSWTDKFKNACASLGNSPNTIEILNFFNDYGTHGLALAAFGQTCTSSIFMKSGYSMSTYYAFKSKESSYDSSFLWWSSSKHQSESNEEKEDKESGFQYSVADRRCYGEIATDSTCGGGMAGTGHNSPAIISWTYKPIWDMHVPELSQGAKNKLKSVFELFMSASVHCMETSCNGRGACAPKNDWWTHKKFTSGSIDFDATFDGNKCFCAEEYIGNKCEKRKEIPLKEKVLGGYENYWDERFQKNDGIPLCGMWSRHDNDTEDRRFKFYTCGFFESQYAEKVGNDAVTSWTNWDEEWRLECEANKVLIGVESYHSNGAEDRRWRITCRQFKDSRTDNCVGFPSTYVNHWDEMFDFTCPSGKVLTGIESVHHNGAEDRRFKFKCCSLLIHKHQDIELIKKYFWTGYYNDFDKPVTAVALIDGKKAAISGVSSYHSNHAEDRRYRFKYSTAQNMILTPYHDTQW